MMPSNHRTDDSAHRSDTTLPSAEPLPPLESHLADAEALDRVAATGEVFGELRRGRVEAQTHRISEEVTRRAQERRQAEQRRQAQLKNAPAFPSDSTTSASSQDAESKLRDPMVLEQAVARLPESLAFKRILVPLDGSERSERAISVAARIAAASLGSLLLVRVVSPQVIRDVGMPALDDHLEVFLDDALDYLQEVAHRDELADVEVHKKVLSGASAAETLLGAIELYNCDLIVISSHGRTGLARLALGSVAQQIVQRSPTPVLVLRPESMLPLVAQSAAEPVVRALVTLDGSPLAEEALVPAARLVAALAGQGRGALHLLRVADLSFTHSDPNILILPYRDTEEARLEEARTYLYRTAQRLEQGELAPLGLRVSWSVLDDVDAACGILDEARSDEGATLNDIPNRIRYDLIALATHGRTGLMRLALGSVAERVLVESGLPALIVRPRSSAVQPRRA